MFFPRFLYGAKNKQYTDGNSTICAQVLPDHFPLGSYVDQPASSSQEVGIGDGSNVTVGSIVGVVVREGCIVGTEVGTGDG